MIASKYSDLLIYTGSKYNVPESFFESAEEPNSCIFLVSCLNHESILYIDNSFEMLTGYPAKALIENGLSFWFPLIHHEDIPMVTAGIKKSYEALANPEVQRPFPPMVLEYRFKRPSGDWLKIRETKYLLLEGSDISVDKVLCKFEWIDEEKESCNKLLDFALTYGQGQRKPNQFINSEIPPLTKREKEILLLIAKGLSSKMIADRCNISINTVETHRRHLLEKLKVKNSMELIKEASKIFSFD